MKITILIPAHNEEKSIKQTVESCLAQTRPADQILIVNDGSTDRTGDILQTFGDKIQVLTLPKATGNKSYAQEQGLRLVTGDVFISTDGDSVLKNDFVAITEQVFLDEKVSAMGGYLRSQKYNWLTACRAYEYALGQNLHKLAQDYLGYLFVIPGAASAFRTEVFIKHLSFEHDTITEDLDFTYRLHELGLRVVYNRNAVVFTQDPASLKSYANQMRRWFGGGWQCLIKHHELSFFKPSVALELSLMYMEGIIFSFLLFFIPLISLHFYGWFILSYFVLTLLFAIYASWKEKRSELLLVPIPYILLMYINSYIFLEQLFKEVVFRRKNLTWFHPERVESKITNTSSL